MNFHRFALAALLLTSCATLRSPLAGARRDPSAPLPPLPRQISDPGAEAASRFLKGRVAELGGNLEEAGREYERVLVLDPAADEVHRRLIDVYARQGEPERALQHARPILERGEPDAETRSKVGALFEWIARDRIERKDMPGALQMLREKLDLFPGDLGALEGIIRLQTDAGDEKALISTLEERSRFHPENLVSRFELGFTYFELERYPEAIRELEPVLQAAPQEAKLKPLVGRIRLVLGRARGKTRATAAALEALRGVRADDPVFEAARTEEARLLEEAGRRKEAIETLRRAISGRPFSALHVTLAETLQRAGQRPQAIAVLRAAIQGEPEQGARARLALANILREAGQADQAVKTLREVDRSDPAYLEARLGLVQTYESASKIPEAIAELTDLTREHPDALQLQVYLAGLTRRQGNLEGATKILEGVVSASKGSSEGDRARYALGRFYHEAGDSDRAVQVLGEIEEGGEVHDEARLVLAQIHEERGEFGRAVEEVEKLIAERPDAAELQIYAAGLLQRAGKVQEALARLEKLEVSTKQDKGRVRYLLGRLYAQADRPVEAERVLREVSRQDPAYPDAQLALVQLLDEQKRPSEALLAMRKAVELRPEAVELRVYLAELTQRTGDLPGAIRIMEQLIRDNPKRVAELQYRLGVIYGQAGQDDRALEVMMKALQGEGHDDARVLNYVGYTWADRGVKLAEAERMIRRAAELEPKDGAIADSLGWVLYKRGLELRGGGQEQSARSSMEAALVELDRATKLEPKDPTITRHLGDVYRSLSRFADAVQTYRRALELQEDESEAQKIRKDIEAIEAQLRGDRSGDAR